MSIHLICVVHDAEGRLANAIRQAAPTLGAVYSRQYIAVSELTSALVVSALIDCGFEVQTVPKAGATNARHDALHLVESASCSHFHYADLDKILTWALTQPAELATVPETIAAFDYTILGRTSLAFHSHPESWTATEDISNRIFSLEFGQQVDITAGSCGLSSLAISGILEHSQRKPTDAEWPMIVHRILHGSVGYRAVDGLSYSEDINAPRSNQSDARTWLTRLRMAHLIGDAAVTTGKSEG